MALYIFVGPREYGVFAAGEPEKDPIEFYGHLMPKLQQLKMDPSFLTRNVNEGFSGGEKKRNEILQLAVLEADLPGGGSALVPFGSGWGGGKWESIRSGSGVPCAMCHAFCQ